MPETGGEGRLTASAWPRAPTAPCISSAHGGRGCPSPRRTPRERNAPPPCYDGYLVLATQCSVTGQDTRRLGFRSPPSSAVFSSTPTDRAGLFATCAGGPRELTGYHGINNLTDAAWSPSWISRRRGRCFFRPGRVPSGDSERAATSLHSSFPVGSTADNVAMPVGD